jgi:putative phosphoesterase
MKIGIVSDTHDDIGNVKKIVNILKEKKIKKLFHLGDYVAPPLLKEFKDFDITGIFGNNDGYKSGLINTFKEINGDLLGDFGKIEIDGIKIALTHGEFREIAESLAKSGDYDVVFFGHWHKAERSVYKNALLLNPGSANKYYTGDRYPTFGIFNTEDKNFDIISIQ